MSGLFCGACGAATRFDEAGDLLPCPCGSCVYVTVAPPGIAPGSTPLRPFRLSENDRTFLRTNRIKAEE